VVWAVIAAQLAPPFMFSGVGVALPTLGAELHGSASALGLVETLFLGGSASFLLLLGRLADASDKRTLYKLGLLGFGVLSLVIGSVSWMPAILVLRFAQGIAAATFTVTGPAILTELVPAERRGRVFGASMGAAYAGLTLGPIAAGALVDAWGWRSVFWVGGGVLVVLATAMHGLLASRWRWPGRFVHAPSVALLIGAVLACVMGAASLHDGALGVGLLAGGLTLGAVFVLWQPRLERPLIDVRALARHPVLRDALAVQGLLYMNAYTSLFMASLYLQVTLEQPPDTAGQVLALGSVVMAVLAPLAGRLADYVPARQVASVGVGLVLLSALLGLGLDATTTLPYVALVLGVQSAGFAMFSSPNMTLIMGSVPPSEVGIASALGAKARSLGMLSGMVMTAGMIAFELGDAPIADQPLPLMAAVVRVYAILVVAVSLSLLLSILSSRRPLVAP